MSKFDSIKSAIDANLEVLKALLKTSKELHALLLSGDLSKMAADKINAIAKNVDITLDDLGSKIENLIKEYNKSQNEVG